MRIILYSPQIPQNTGNIVRTCKATGASLALIKPLGFKTSNKALRRAGLDYWDGVDVSIEEDIAPLLLEGPFYLFSSKGKILYTEVEYTPETTLVFGSETEGLPSRLLDAWPERLVTIPMEEGARCLNLSNAVAIGAYELLRQKRLHLQQKKKVYFPEEMNCLIP